MTYFQINSASSSDGGNYTCSPQHIISDSVIVTIMDGEGKSAAVYKDSVTSAGTNGQKSTEFLFIVILCSSLLQLWLMSLNHHHFVREQNEAAF